MNQPRSKEDAIGFLRKQKSNELFLKKNNEFGWNFKAKKERNKEKLSAIFFETRTLIARESNSY